MKKINFDAETMRPRREYLTYFAETCAAGISQTREGEAMRLLGIEFLRLLEIADTARKWRSLKRQSLTYEVQLDIRSTADRLDNLLLELFSE